MENLRTALKAAAQYYVPVSFKAIALGFYFNEICQPVAGFMLPTAEDYLRAKGLDPAISRQLTDKTVRLRDRTTPFGYLHALHDMYGLPNIIMSAYLFKEDGLAYAKTDSMFSALTGFRLHHLNQCHVLMPGPNFGPQHLVSPGDAVIENLPDSEQTLLFVLLHELAHCDKHKHDHETHSDEEARADIKAYDLMKKYYPEFVDFILHFRAYKDSPESHSHDTALYLDAHIQGKPLPAGEAVTKALDEFLEYTDKLSEKTQSSRYIVSRYALSDPANPLTPLARRRAELYVQAYERFNPWARDMQIGHPAPDS